VRLLILACIAVFLWGCGAPSQRTTQRTTQQATVVGTKWAWNDGKTVEFLPGGRVRYSNYVHGGNWQQNGNAVTFDQNGVVLFSVVVAGDTMRGSWRALKGDDTRVTIPTSLKRTE
jgi:hypothetical protein